MSIGISHAEIERIDRAWNDAFAARRGWEEYHLAEPVRDLQLFFSSLPRGSRILDAGCGWGRYAGRFAEHDFDYTGIDHSAGMLHVAHTGNPGMRFVCGTLGALPFSDAGFDGVWSCCALSAFPKRRLAAILAEHRRVLRERGVVMVIMPDLGFSDEDMVPCTEGPPIFLATYFLDELEDYVASAGLEIIDVGRRFEAGAMYVLARKVF